VDLRATLPHAHPMPPSAKQRPVKAQARAIERLLKRDGLAPAARAAKESELAALRGEVTKQNRTQREKHFSKKYHGIKFIERRKVERRIAQLERRIAAAEGGTAGASADAEKDATALAELSEARKDLLYIEHFPRTKKYLSLFPAANGDDPYVATRRRRIRALIVRRVEAGLPVGRLSEADGGDEAAAEAAVAAGGDGEDDDVEGDDFFAAGAGDDDVQEADAVPEPAANRKRRREGGSDGAAGQGKKAGKEGKKPKMRKPT